MITVKEYFNNPKTGKPKRSLAFQREAADDMLTRVNTLLTYLKWDYPTNPYTKTAISGVKGGTGGGGFRLPDEEGAEHSQHKEAHAVDVFDPGDILESWLSDDLLEKFELYREHPGATPGWVHLQDVAPESGRRTFRP